MTFDPLNSPEPKDISDNPVDWSTGATGSGSERTLDKVEVEDEVLAAVEEGKADAESSEETQTQEPEEAQESEEAQKVRLREEKTVRLRGTPSFVADLRRSDTPLVRTCGYCLTRKALGNFLRGIESNYCLDCEGR